MNFGLFLACVAAYLGVYILVDRICKCAENCSISRAFGKVTGQEMKKFVNDKEKGVMAKMDDVDASIKK